MEYPEKPWSLSSVRQTSPKEFVNKTSDSCMDENAHENPRSIHDDFVLKFLLLYYLT